MRESEKKFLNLVNNELTPVYKIQDKLGMNMETAYEFAFYLEKMQLVRTSYMTMQDGNRILLVTRNIGTYRYWIYKPENYRWLITTIIAVAALFIALYKK